MYKRNKNIYNSLSSIMRRFLLRNSDLVEAVDGTYDVEECTFNKASLLSLSCFIVGQR